ncbi:MAG: hypothetical protein Q9191_005814 [Dirinaria sp. TL-2023a]
MSEPVNIKKTQSDTVLPHDNLSPGIARTTTNGSSTSSPSRESPNLIGETSTLSSTPPSPESLSRNASFSTKNDNNDDWEAYPPIERLTVFDLFDNLALPQRLESWQNKINAQTEKVRRQREKLKLSGRSAKDRVVEEWRRRLPPPDEQIDKYRKRMRDSVDRLGARWNDTKAVTAREKLAFIAGVLNVFISGYLVGAHPEMFYYWFTAQLCYFMPIRYYTYHARGYHYFLADMCYFVNLLLLLTIWVAPQSKRLFISTYCLAYGNNAVAIAMWRNSKARFPAVYAIKYSSPDRPEHYDLWAMMFWATFPYAVWQLSYHFFITVRRREKIAAGRPTSFTWLRKSYANTWIGRLILSLPESLHEPAFMLTQYAYALATMIPCPIWFWYRWPSAIFLLTVFVWSVYNGATFYIDVFGKRFQKELEQLKQDMAKWQNSVDGAASPVQTSKTDATKPSDMEARDSICAGDSTKGVAHKSSIDRIPLLDGKVEGAHSSGMDGGGEGHGGSRERTQSDK